MQVIFSAVSCKAINIFIISTNLKIKNNRN